MKEREWRELKMPPFEGLYWVSNDGFIKSKHKPLTPVGGRLWLSKDKYKKQLNIKALVEHCFPGTYPPKPKTAIQIFDANDNFVAQEDNEHAAARLISAHASAVYNCVRGLRKTANGYKFKKVFL